MTRKLHIGRILFALVPLLAISSGAQATLANRVFVAAKSGNDANACNSVTTPCQTFAGAITQVSAGGEIIALESGGYGPVTINMAVTINAPAGIVAFIHPPSGDAITINAGSTDTVILRGLTLNGGAGNGITVSAVGTLNVENCFIAGFTSYGIHMLSNGRLNVTGTDITACNNGVLIFGSTGLVQASIDHCHLDGNAYGGFYVRTTSPGSSTTTATYSTANHNSYLGWICGSSTSGKDVLNLEFCTGSENAADGLVNSSANALSVARYSNCVFANNASYGVMNDLSGTVETRGNNTITGNGTAATYGTIGSFSPM
jgi:hypothetical protein